MAASTAVLSGLSRSNLRPLDRKRDLYAVADLIELCFADTLDEDGRNYIKHLRYASFQQKHQRTVFEEESMNLDGYVWDVDGKIVGNLSMLSYPGVFYPFDSKVMMIANVAVHPSYRRQGIARQLTQKAIEDLKRREKKPIWLHVRAENYSAYHLYTSLGFVERFRRTIWVHDHPLAVVKVDYEEQRHHVCIMNRRKNDWQKQKNWFIQAYPPEMWWYYAITPRLLQPGLIGFLYSMMTNIILAQWSVFLDQQLIGVAAWQPTNHFADYLWLMVGHEYEKQALFALIPFLAQHYGRRKPFSIDYPYQRGNDVLRQYGFREHSTLIWMSLSS